MNNDNYNILLAWMSSLMETWEGSLTFSTECSLCSESDSEDKSMISSEPSLLSVNTSLSASGS